MGSICQHSNLCIVDLVRNHVLHGRQSLWTPMTLHHLDEEVLAVYVGGTHCGVEVLGIEPV